MAAGGLGGGAAGTPTPKVKFPETGCPSSDTTCHTTRYEARGSPGRSPTDPDAASPPGWVTAPVSTRCEAASSTTIARAGRLTASSKVTVTADGWAATSLPAAGLVDWSSAWADAGPAPSTSRARSATRVEAPRRTVAASAVGDPAATA